LGSFEVMNRTIDRHRPGGAGPSHRGRLSTGRADRSA